MGFASKLGQAGSALLEGFSAGFGPGMQLGQQRRTEQRLQTQQDEMLRMQRRNEAFTALDRAPLGQKAGVVDHYSSLDPALGEELARSQSEARASAGQQFQAALAGATARAGGRVVPGQGSLTADPERAASTLQTLESQQAAITEDIVRLRQDALLASQAGLEYDSNLLTDLENQQAQIHASMRQLESISQFSASHADMTIEDLQEARAIHSAMLEAAGVEELTIKRLWGVRTAAARSKRMRRIEELMFDPHVTPEQLAPLTRNVTGAIVDLATSRAHLISDDRITGQTRQRINDVMMLSSTALSEAKKGNVEPAMQLAAQLQEIAATGEPGTELATHHATMLTTLAPALSRVDLTETQRLRAERAVMHDYTNLVATTGTSMSAMEYLAQHRRGQRLVSGTQTPDELEMAADVEALRLMPVSWAQSGADAKRREADAVQAAKEDIAAYAGKPDVWKLFLDELRRMQLPLEIQRAYGIAAPEAISLHPSRAAAEAGGSYVGRAIRDVFKDGPGTLTPMDAVRGIAAPVDFVRGVVSPKDRK